MVSAVGSSAEMATADTASITCGPNAAIVPALASDAATVSSLIPGASSVDAVSFAAQGWRIDSLGAVHAGSFCASQTA